MCIRESKITLAGKLALVLLLLAAADVRSVAQAIYGSLVGTVTDQSGAVVPNAGITATEITTGAVRQDKTDSSGRYTIVNVLPGTYKVDVSAPGFKNFGQTGLTVTPNVVSRVDVHLQIGQATEQVTVAADATQLQTDKADTHAEITSRAVATMPLGGTRNYQSMIDLAPGATPGAFVNSATDNPSQPLSTNINGGNAQTNVTRIDGAESVNTWLPQYAGYVVPAETVDVVNVTTSAADADQGLAGASSITVVTKSGTNEIHGSAFEFHNDQHLNARNFFLQGEKPVGIYNNYGATLGGPIVKNKLFYFGSFNGLNQKSSANGLYTVPTADQRAGNFSAYNTPIYDPTTGNADGTGRKIFAGGVIPSNLISPAAQKLQSYYPAPNLPGISNNYAASGGPVTDYYQTDVKVNWNRTDKHSIYFKYDNLTSPKSGGTAIFGVAGGPAPGADPGLGVESINVASIGHTYTITPNLLLDGTIGYQRANDSVTGNDYGQNFGPALGIPGLNGPDIRDSGFPDITIGGYTEFGVPNWMPSFRTDETYSNSDNLTWTKGAHELRFGFDMVRHHLNHWQPEISPGGPRGLLDFNGQATALNAPNAAATNQFNSYAQFLLGYSNEVQKGVQYILLTAREWQFGWYAQDRWQISPKLTVNLGVRYELYPLMSRAGYGIERYDPTTNDVYMGGRGDQPEDVGITVSHKLFAPRAGIAYRLDDKTVIRAGYGLNFDPLAFARPLRGWYPLTINGDTSSPNSYSYASTLSAGIPPVALPDLSTGIVPLDPTASERSPWGGEIHRGYVQSWNFTVERKLPLDLVTSVAYVGQHSTHLFADQNINAGYPGSGTAGLPYAAIYGRTIATNMWDGYLSSSYNSLQVSVNRSFSNGLLIKGAYTYSHAIDYADADGWTGVDWSYAPDFQRNRATAGFDRAQVFQLGWVYDLPFGKDKAYLTTGIGAKVLGGWEVSGRMACYTGTPFTVTASDTSLNDAGTNTQTANQVMTSVPFTGLVGPGQTYYNPAAFAPVTTQSFGNSGRNILRNPGVWNTDLSIVRNFPVTERLQLQFRTEMYNLPNTSHFGGVDASVNDASFMQVTSSSGERNIRFAFRLQW